MISYGKTATECCMALSANGEGEVTPGISN
jgi:hypothetical protein